MCRMFFIIWRNSIVLTPPRFAVLPFIKRGDYPLMKSFGMDYQGRLSPFEKGEYPDRGEGLEKKSSEFMNN